MMEINENLTIQHIRTLIHNCLVNEIKCQVDFLHEFTDGGSAQYKSRHHVGAHVLCLKRSSGTVCKGIILRHPTQKQNRMRQVSISNKELQWMS